MIDIIVQRTPGDSMGEDIQNPLISSVEVAIERGRVEIDSHSGLHDMQVTAVIRPSVARGDLVEIHDELNGKSWRGKVNGVSFSISNEAETPTVNLSIDKVDA